jgi:Pentapeptide repeats (8 copies)
MGKPELLIGALLYNADLRGANLTEAVISEEQLLSANNLEGTTMPDGQTLRGGETPHGPTFEDWLKSKSREENIENE